MSNWTETEITRQLGLRYPIIQGPFGRGASAALPAATASNAGGLGSYGSNEQDPARITKTAVEIRKLTGRLARGIYHRFASEMKVHEPLLAKYPAQSWILLPLRAAALAQGRHDLVALWSGQAASLCRHHNAGELFESLIKETDHLLKHRPLPAW